MISNGAFTITKIDKKAGGQKGKTFLTTCLVYREGGGNRLDARNGQTYLSYPS